MENNEYKSGLMDLFMKLNSWKENSQRELSTFMFNTYADFSNIITSQSTIIDKEINSLVEQVGDLKGKLSIMTQERNDLKETVVKLSIRNRKLCAQLEENLFNNSQENSVSGENDRETEEDVDNVSMIENEPEDHLNHEEIMNVSDESDKTPVTVQQMQESIQYPVFNNVKQDDNNHQTLCEQGLGEGNQQEEREDIEGVDEKEPNEAKEEIVQFEDAKGDLHTLLRTFDKSKRKHACGHCPYTSSSKSHLREHVENVHEKIRRHFCKECDYASYRKRGLNHHIKVVHEKSMHVCEDCGYSIERKALLNSHRASVHGISYKSF